MTDVCSDCGAETDGSPCQEFGLEETSLVKKMAVYFENQHSSKATLRDQFAMAALASISDCEPKELVDWAYNIANAMMERRKR